MLNIKIKVNSLEYNPNRDPQVYRRSVKEPFRIQGIVNGEGDARCSLLDAQGGVLAEKTFALPGVFAHEIAFDTPGTRIVTFSVESGGTPVHRDLRLDVLEHASTG